MKKYKIAILGAHEIGGVLNLKLEGDEKQFEIFEVVGCYDPDAPKAEMMSKFANIKKMTLDEIMNDDSIDIIVNGLLPKLVYETTKMAFEHNKHVFCGKMIAYTVEQGKELVQMAKERRLLFGCGPDCVLGASMQTARYVVDHGIIGNIRSGVISLSRNNDIFADELPYLVQKGGNILYDMGGYYIGSIINLLGSVKRITAMAATTDASHKVIKVTSEYLGKEYPTEDFNILTAVLEFENGALVTLHLNSKSVLEQKITFDVYGDKGIMSMGHPHDFNPPIYIMKNGTGVFEFPLVHGYQEMGYSVGVADMCWALENHRQNRLDADYALHMLEIAHGIETSAKTGQIYEMTTSTKRPDALEEGFVGKGYWAPGEETVFSI